MNERSLEGANFAFIGGSSGIGFAAATAVARRGASIVIIGRDSGRGERATKSLLEAGANDASFVAADLTSIAGIQTAVEGIQAWRPALHGVVHSAMLLINEKRVTTDGLEYMFALQYLARYALNRALLEQLVASEDGRIVHVAGKAPPGVVPDLDDLQFERRKWSLMPAGESSQVLGYLHIQEASKRWEQLPITASLVAVGFTKSDIMRAMPWYMRAMTFFGATPERSAANVVELLTGKNVREANGAVLPDPRRFAPKRLEYPTEIAQKTWELSEALLRERGMQLSDDQKQN